MSLILPEGIEDRCVSIFSRARRVARSSVRVIVDTYREHDSYSTVVRISVEYNPTMIFQPLSFSNDLYKETYTTIDPYARATWGYQLTIAEEEMYNARAFRNSGFFSDYIAYNFERAIADFDFSDRINKKTSERIRHDFPKKQTIIGVRKVRF